MISFSTLIGDEADLLRKRNFQLLLLANVLPPLGSSLLSPVLDSLIEPFGITPGEIGLMISIFSAPAIVLIPVAGWLSDRYGRKLILVSGLFIFGICGTTIAFTTSYRIVLMLRLLQGMGFACTTSIIIASLGDLYKGTEEATAQGIRFTGSGISQTVFPLLSGVLVSAAWQYPFFIYALSFPIAAVIYVWFDEPTRLRNTESIHEHNGGKSYLGRIFELAKHRRVITVLLARATPPAVWIGFLTYNSIIIVHLLNESPVQAGILAAIGSVAYATAATQTGRITATFGNRKYVLYASQFAISGGFTVVLFAQMLSVACVGILILGLGFGTALPIYRSVITGIAPVTLRGGLVSLSESLGRVAATVSPILMGVSIDILTPVLGFKLAIQIAGFGLAVTAVLCGTICLFIASRSPPVGPVEQA